MTPRFESLARNLMDEVLSWEPVMATQLGWHKYDSILGEQGPEAYRRRADRCRELTGLLQAVPASSLKPDEQLDRDLAIHLLRNRAFEYGELRLHEHGCLACGTIGYSLFFLSYRDFPSAEQRMESITGRIESVPNYVERAKKSLTRPYRLWNEASYEVASELPSFFRSMEKLVRANAEDGDTLRRVSNAVKDATAAVEEYMGWLSKELLPSASEDFAITPEEYARYLDVRDCGLTPEQILDIGEAHLRACKAAIADLSHSITPSGNYLDAIRSMKSDHPADSEGVMTEYRSAVARAREFTIAKDLCTVPEGEQLVVTETPEFLRPLFAFAGQFEPGKFDGSRTGLFLVTPPGDDPSMLREHSHAGIVNTAVHEGYPGHHLQGICSNTNPSPVRVLSASPDFGEGWGLYTEQLMVEHGFSDSTLGRLAVLNDLHYRILRMIIEVRLVLGTLDVNGAVRMLESESFVGEKAARSEVRACAMSPGYFSSYPLGKLALHQLRDDVKRAMGQRFSLKFFHDSMLYAGCLPMGFMRRAVSIRMKEEHGVVLPANPESLYDYSMRAATDGYP